jgi:hypothetical protein
MGLGDSTVEGKGTPVFGDRNFSQGDPGKPILFPCRFSVGDCSPKAVLIHPMRRIFEK